MLKFGDFEPIPIFGAYAGEGTSSQRYVEEEKSTENKMFFLSGVDCSALQSYLILVSPSTDTSNETMTWELGRRALCYDVLPDKLVVPYDWPKLTGATLLVSVGSHIYCIGGKLDSNLPSKHIYRFNTNNPEKGLKGCSKMLKERAYPAVVSMGGKIYVFGGLPPFEEDYSPWAEFLDTNKPKQYQKWKALKDPIFPRPCTQLGCTQLFAFPYDAESIVIGCGIVPNEEALLYNVVYKTWSKYECFPKICSRDFASPVTLVNDKTVYWIEDRFLMAYELDTRLQLCVDLSHSVFCYESFLSAAYAPRLVHLEDNLFGFFTMFCFNQHIEIVECTKVRVTKVYSGDLYHPGTMDLSVVGYESYQCDPIHQLSGVMSMEATLGGSNN